MRIIGLSVPLAAQLVAIFCANNCSGGFLSYTDRSAFDNAATFSGYSTSDVDFDDVDTSGGPVSISSGGSHSGVTFAYNFGGVGLTVTDVYDTTSPVNFLGTDDGDILQDGDNITFSFSPRTGFGLYLISLDFLLDGDFELTDGTNSAVFELSAQQGTLGDGSGYWFLGLLSDDSSTFTSVTLNTLGGGGAFLYNIDDLVLASGTTPMAGVPEPSSLALLVSGGLIGALRMRRRKAAG